MAAFLAQIEAAAQSLSALRREQILDRLNAARPLLGDTDASRWFSALQSPQERLVIGTAERV
jgi:hypothetical protein